MPDLKSVRLICLKAVLLLVCGLLSGGVLLIDHPDAKTALLLAIAVWSFCRCYYFAFYVIQHYVDPGFRFAGLWHFAKYCLRRKSRSSQST